MLYYISLNEDLLKDNTITIENNNLIVNKCFRLEKICDYILKVGNKIVANFELNKRYYKGLIKKNMVYIFTIYSSNLKKVEMYSNYEELKINQINLNNFTRYKEALPSSKCTSKETSEKIEQGNVQKEIEHTQQYLKK